jgi:LGFP repeat
VLCLDGTYGRSIYSTRGTAFEVHGAILDEWLRTGGSQGWLGYPTSDEYDDGQGGRRSNFENGRVWAGHGVAGAHTEPQWLMYEYAPIVFGTALTIGGYATLYLFSNGQTRFQGHLHDSGPASYTTQVTMAVADATQKHAIVFTHTGQANGDLSVEGSPDDTWDDWRLSPDVIDLWDALKDGSSWHGASRVDGYVVFGKIVQILPELYDALFSDGSKGAREDGTTVNPYLGPTGEESVPPAALRAGGVGLTALVNAIRALQP